MAKILVIDDEPMVLRTLERLLKRADHEVQLADNGMEGLRAFRRIKPDLVITDIVMPVKEGLDTIRLLRSWAPELQIIAISGGNRLGSTNLLAQAAELGADSILTKPFDPAELLARVSHCLAAAAAAAASSDTATEEAASPTPED
jgi:DNA-binding response OmpR family regulator